MFQLARLHVKMAPEATNLLYPMQRVTLLATSIGDVPCIAKDDDERTESPAVRELRLGSYVATSLRVGELIVAQPNRKLWLKRQDYVRGSHTNQVWPF